MSNRLDSSSIGGQKNDQRRCQGRPCTDGYALFNVRRSNSRTKPRQLTTTHLHDINYDKNAKEDNSTCINANNGKNSNSSQNDTGRDKSPADRRSSLSTCGNFETDSKLEFDEAKNEQNLQIPKLKFTLDTRPNSRCDLTDNNDKEKISIDDQSKLEINNNFIDDNSKIDGRMKILLKNSGTGVEKVRQEWDNKLQFVLSLISYAVGLGNIWRFPYLCQRNGGGAFLIPYTISLVFLGIPLFYLELGIGQKLRTGSIGVWNKIHPFLGGVGISSAIVSFLLGLYYNVIIAWCIFYMVNSFQWELPWEHCPKNANGTIVSECQLSSATSYFWYHRTLKVSSGLTDFENRVDGFNWPMVVCLISAWAIVFLSLMKGIKSSGKVMCFTAIFPYIVLTIFFVRAVTLKGAVVGLKYMLNPDLNVLRDPRVWLEAATQIFFSFGLAFGGLIAFASYNNQKNDCRRDTLVVSMTNYFTSLYAAVVIFAILGFQATNQHEKCLDRQVATLVSNLGNQTNFYFDRQSTVDLSKLYPSISMEKCNIENELTKAGGGTGLAFITFTEAMLKFPGAPFWAIIFFLMLLSLGLGSMIGTLEGVVTSFHDLSLFRRLRKEVIAGILCAVSLLIGFLFITGPGVYWFELFDNFTGSFALMAVALLENVAVVYVYGWKKFCNDLLFMTSHYPSKYWSITWRFISPVAMSTILISSLVQNLLDAPKYTVYDKHSASITKKDLPFVGQLAAILIVTISILPLPTVLAYRLIRWKCSKQSSIRKARRSDLKLILEESLIASHSSAILTDQLLNQRKNDGTDSGLGSLEARLAANDDSSSSLI